MSDELRMQAYIDDELSTSEATEFEESLPPAERKRLAAERRVEAAIATQLSAAPGCPEETWQATLTAISPSEDTTTKGATGRILALRVAVALAAMIILVFSVQSALNESITPPLELPTNLSYDTAIAVTQFFEDEHIDLELAEANDNYHALKLIGARRTSMDKDTVHEIYYTCCDQPVRVVVALDGSHAATRILHNLESGKVQQARNIGKYVIGLLSTHEAPGLLDNVHIKASLALLGS